MGRGRDGLHGRRLRGLIVILWRAGLRVQEALALAESDLDPRRGALLVRRGKADGAAKSAWTTGDDRNYSRGSTCALSSPSARCSASSTARRAAGTGPAQRPAPSCDAPQRPPRVRRRFAPHLLRHAHAVEMAREGVPLIVIQRLLGHDNLGITSIYLQGIDNAEIIETVNARRAPMVPVSAASLP
jgi:integrase